MLVVTVSAKMEFCSGNIYNTLDRETFTVKNLFASCLGSEN